METVLHIFIGLSSRELDGVEYVDQRIIPGRLKQNITILY